MVVWLEIMLWSEEMEMNFGTPSSSPLQHNKQQTKKTFIILWKTNLTTVLGPIPCTLVIILFPVPTIFPFLWTLVLQNQTWLNLFYLLNKSPIISDILFFFHVISSFGCLSIQILEAQPYTQCLYFWRNHYLPRGRWSHLYRIIT